MIKASHNTAAQFIFYAYIKRLMKKHFAHFYLVNEPPMINSADSLIITPNHISWWDGFFVGHLEKKFYNRKVHIMMLEEQLKKYWFFGKVGAFSIRPENLRSLSETILYSRKLVKQNSNSLIIYPQGEIEDFEKRPLILKKGLKSILADINAQASILPVGFKIQYYNEMKPSIVARFGKPLQSNNVVGDYSLFENEFYDNLDLLSDAAKSKSFYQDLFDRDRQ